MSTDIVLDKAWKVLEQKGWCKSHYALDADKKSVDPHDPSACSFCTVGAIMRAYGDDDDTNTPGVKARIKLIEYLQKSSKNVAGSITVWNDNKGQTKKQVISVLKELDI